MATSTPVLTRGRQRMCYADALRGFSILLVVCHHIFGKLGPIMADHTALALRDCLVSFRMPLFFFMSGYFAYRASHKWDKSKIKEVLSKKVKAQIIGTAVFATAFAWCFHHDIQHFLLHIGQEGYWFTITLFQMFVIYLLITAGITRKAPHLEVPVLIASAMCFAGIFIQYCTLPMQQFPPFPNLAWGKLAYYYPYFVIGLLARRGGDSYHKLLSSKIFTLLIIGGFIITELILAPYIPHTLPGYALWYLPGIAGVLSLSASFYRMQHFFAGNSALAKALTFTGKRTLEIYFIHYFFLPDAAFIPQWFYGNNPIVPMLSVTLAIAVPVICLCLLISGLIRTSPILASWLLGSRREPEMIQPKPTHLPEIDNRMKPHLDTVRTHKTQKQAEHIFPRKEHGL